MRRNLWRITKYLLPSTIFYYSLNPVYLHDEEPDTPIPEINQPNDLLHSTDEVEVVEEEKQQIVEMNNMSVVVPNDCPQELVNYF